MPETTPFVFAKIIATLGPASDTPDKIAKLILEGARVFRINFSHGSFEGFGKLLAAVREASKITGIHAGALGDLCGPKLRIGDVIEGGINVAVGDNIVIQKKPTFAGKDPLWAVPGYDVRAIFATNSPAVIEDVKPGERLLINDGEVRTLVLDKQGTGDSQLVVCRVTIGGPITKGKGINLPDTGMSVPSLTPHDFKCIEWAVKNGVDFLALSFVRKGDDVRQLKQHLATVMPAGQFPIPVISKIEKPQALDDLEAIVDLSDGVMVARGDLGVEMDVTDVPAIQKRIIAMAHQRGKPVIVATQMLQSMIENATPTRAEVSDVANAIYDGAGKVMLSGETAVGKYPVMAVQTMARVAKATTEQILAGHGNDVWTQPPQWRETGKRSAALSNGVRQIVRDFGAKFVAIWSQTGGGAKYLSISRVGVPIIAVCNDIRGLQRMSWYFGVHAVYMEPPTNIEVLAYAFDQMMLEKKWAAKGDPYVLVAGEPLGSGGTTNTASLRYVGGKPV